MARYTIEVVAVTPPQFTKTQKGGYNQIEVAYKSDGKIMGKKLFDFVNPAVYKLMVNAKAGDIFTTTVEKDEKGYNQWVDVEAGQASEPAENDPAELQPKTAAASPAPVARPGRVVGNTYETAEERAIRQAAIIRQATLNAAVAFAPKADPEDLLELAGRFEDYVYGNLDGKASLLQSLVANLKK